jgi:ubiquinone/menaquinone biosynthesis C-methylase UbiE
VRFDRRTLFRGAAAILAAGLGGKWLVERLSQTGVPLAGPQPAAPQPAPAAGAALMDVAEFKKTMSVEALNETAEAYFARVTNWEFHHALPLWHPAGAANQLTTFAHVLHGLNLLPGMSVVDFGAGSCWASRWLTQLGMAAIALDVSPTALKIGQALYERMPVVGERPKPRFLVFDGHRIDLPDASVDRILCQDTFHHLLNPDEVLREMSRVLKPAGIAGFAEPGPNHSRSPQSQFEMRNFKVLEDDVHIERIWAAAQRAGFTGIQLAIFNVPTHMVSIEEFEGFLAGGKATQQFAELVRAQMHDRRIFFLQNAGRPPPPDSRSRAGLRGTLQVELGATEAKPGGAFSGRAVIVNSGSATWLPHNAGVGAVMLACHLLDPSGRVLTQGYTRVALGSGGPRAIAPGERASVEVRVPAPAPGRYLLEFDLVSDNVAWFSALGNPTVRIPVEVR